jgi:hypothetical protein
MLFCEHGAALWRAQSHLLSIFFCLFFFVWFNFSVRVNEMYNITP